MWNYDASRFRDNMTIVAQVYDEGAMWDDEWCIGAFVGDECRGEGRLVDGKFFITVHADAGEVVSFKLPDEVAVVARQPGFHHFLYGQACGARAYEPA